MRFLKFISNPETFIEGSFLVSFSANHSLQVGVTQDLTPVLELTCTLSRCPEDGGLQGGEGLAMLGTIRVVLMQVKNRRKVEPRFTPQYVQALPGESSINERAKKAGAHITKSAASFPVHLIRSHTLAYGRLGPVRKSKSSATRADDIPGTPTPCEYTTSYKYLRSHFFTKPSPSAMLLLVSSGFILSIRASKHEADFSKDFLRARDLVPATFNKTEPGVGPSNSGPSASSSRPSAMTTPGTQDVKPKIERLAGQPSGFRPGEVIDISSDEAPSISNTKSNVSRVKVRPIHSVLFIWMHCSSFFGKREVITSVKQESTGGGSFSGTVIELSD